MPRRDTDGFKKIADKMPKAFLTEAGRSKSVRWNFILILEEKD